MHTPIKAGELLTPQQERAVKAALELVGTDQKSFAAAENLSRGRLNRVIRATEVPSEKYAAALRRLVGKLRSYASAA